MAEVTNISIYKYFAIEKVSDDTGCGIRNIKDGDIHEQLRRRELTVNVSYRSERFFKSERFVHDHVCLDKNVLSRS